MYACAELFCVLTNVSNKFVFRRFPLMGGGYRPLSPLRAPLGPTGEICSFLRDLKRLAFAILPSGVGAGVQATGDSRPTASLGLIMRFILSDTECNGSRPASLKSLAFLTGAIVVLWRSLRNNL